jgi:hypothetical protein
VIRLKKTTARGIVAVAMLRRASAAAMLTLLAFISSVGCGDRAAEKPEPSPSPSDQRAEATGSPCDVAKLHEASAQLTKQSQAWSARSGVVPDHALEAIAAVWLHCPGLPPAAKVMLDALVDHDAIPSLANLAAAQGLPAPAVDDDPLDAKLPGHAAHHRVDAGAWAWRDSVCPDYPAIAEAMSQASAQERGAILWDRCLHRFDVVTRQEYVATIRESGTLGFALHQWLTEQAKIDAAISMPFARAVVLGGHWLVGPPAGLLLPAVASGGSLDDGLVLELRSSAIHLDRRAIATVDAAGRIDPAPSRTPSQAEPIIGPLYDRLAEEADKGKEMAAARGATWSTPLLLVAHRDLTWSTLRPVVASAMLGGFRRVDVVSLVEDRANPLRAVTIHDAAASGAPLELADATSVQGIVDMAAASTPGAVRLLPE